MAEPIPWVSYPILLFPKRIRKNLQRIERAGALEKTPNMWQLSLGVVRMWHRIVFRPETVGMCTSKPVRNTWRAKLLFKRPIRFPFLLKEKAVFPLDLTGLVSSPERLIRHVLGAHHDRDEFVYDLEILACYPGALAELERRAREIVENDSPRSEWMRDLVVFDEYHDRLLSLVTETNQRGVEVPEAIAGDPDYSFRAYMQWCASQPETPKKTIEELARGDFAFDTGRRPLSAKAPTRAGDATPTQTSFGRVAT